MQSFDEHVVGLLIAADVAGYSGLIGVEGTHERLKAHLGPIRPIKMVAWPVSPWVGNVKNNDPSLSEPIAEMAH
jgi:hypothetical protein